jgi:UTP--glucose-1-phosphate uridylyltransferase
MGKVTKAVIAAAGLGTRFLPQTKAMPKEMLPLVDKPIIQHIVEELVGAGIQDIIIVTGYHKRSIEDHFDQASTDLRSSLSESGKKALLQTVDEISNLANFIYIRQKGPHYGNAVPLLNAAHLIDKEPFIYTFADDFVDASPSRFRQILDMHAKHGGSVLTCVPREAPSDYAKFGYVGGDQIDNGLINVKTIVEKPGSQAASPSANATVSGYVLDPVIIEYLQKQWKGFKGKGEFKIQDSMQAMIEDGHKIYGCEIQNGTHYDPGDKLEYIKTVVDFALMRSDIGPELSDYLRNKLL